MAEPVIMERAACTAPKGKKLINILLVFSASHSHASNISGCFSLQKTSKDVLIAKVAGKILDGLPKDKGIAEG